MRRWFAPLAVIAVLAAACAGGADVTDPDVTDPTAADDQDAAAGQAAPDETSTSTVTCAPTPWRS